MRCWWPRARRRAAAPTAAANRPRRKPAAAHNPAGPSAAAPTQPAQAQAGQQVTISLSFIATGSEQMAPLVTRFRESQSEHQGQRPIPAAGHPRPGDGHRAAGRQRARRAVHQWRHRPVALGLRARQSGYLTDLSQRPWAKDVPPAARDMFFDGNKLYGAPMGLSLVGVVYNTDPVPAAWTANPVHLRRTGGPVRQGQSRGQDPDGARGSGARFVRAGAGREHRLRQQSQLERGSRGGQGHLREHARLAGRAAAIRRPEQRRDASNQARPPTRSSKRSTCSAPSKQ